MKNNQLQARESVGDQLVGTEKTISEHLKDLRQVLVSVAVVFFLVFVVIFALFSNTLLSFVIQPIMARGIEVVFVSLAETLTTQLKLSLIAAFVVSLPFIVLRLWSFIRPGLYPHERKAIAPLVLIMIVLFAVGVVFSYMVVFSLVVEFLVYAADDIVTPMISVGQYVGFLFSFVVPFGLAFEMPVVMVVLAKLGFVTWKSLAKARRYVIFGITVLSAFLTPPDILSLILLAVPMIVLYEVGIFATKMVKTNRSDA